MERSRHEVSDVQHAIAAVEPDFLLIDATTVGAAAVAQTTELPWAGWSPFFQHITLPGQPTVAPGLIPFALAPEGMEALNAPREELGLPAIGDPAHTFTAPLYLYLTTPPFEVEGLGLPASFRMVGPGLWEPPANPPAWLDELEEPVVMATISSEYQRDDALIEAVLAAVRDEDMRLVATTVAHEPERFEVPPNARVERFLAHGPLIEKAACVVCHGGMGITQRALAAGVPVCVVPFGRDQTEVAGRVAASGAGTCLMPAELTPSNLRDAIRAAMGRRDGARQVAKGFERAGGARAAADALESLLQNNKAERVAVR
jgi:MGT family glycosyltransferase